MEAAMWKPWADVMAANLNRVPPGSQAGPNAKLGTPPKSVTYSRGVGSVPTNIPDVCSAGVTQTHCVLALGAHNAARNNEMRQLPVHSVQVMYATTRPATMANIPSMKNVDDDLYGDMPKADVGLVPVLVQLHSPWTKQGSARNTEAGSNGQDTVSTWFPSDTPEVCPHLALAMQLKYGVILGQGLPITRKEHGSMPAGDDFPLLRGNYKVKGNPRSGYSYLDPESARRDMDILLAHAGAKTKGLSTHVVRHRFGEMNTHISKKSREAAGHWQPAGVHEKSYEGVALCDWELALALANRKNPDGQVEWLFAQAPDPSKYWDHGLCMFPDVVGVDAFEKTDDEFVYSTVSMRALIRSCQWFNAFVPRQLAALHHLCPALRDICWFRDGLIQFISSDNGATWAKYLTDAQAAFEDDVTRDLITVEAVLMDAIPQYDASIAACFARQVRHAEAERIRQDKQVAELRADNAELRDRVDAILDAIPRLLEIVACAVSRTAGGEGSGPPSDAVPLQTAAMIDAAKASLAAGRAPTRGHLQQHQPGQYITDPRNSGRWWDDQELWSSMEHKYDRSSLSKEVSKATPYEWPIDKFSPGLFNGPRWPMALHDRFNDPQITPADKEHPQGQIHPSVMCLFDKLPAGTKNGSRGHSKGHPPPTPPPAARLHMLDHGP